MTSKDITTAEPPPLQLADGVSPIVHMLASGQVPAEQLEKLIALQERYDKNEARKAYNEAMTRFRSDVKPAKRTGNNTHLRTKYSTFDDVLEAVNGPLGANGFNIEFTQEQPDNKTVKVTCRITHEAGHSESTSLQSAVECHKGINSLQALGLTVSYLKRYTLTALTGVSTEDSDGQMPAQKPVQMCSESDLVDLQAVCESAGKDFGKWKAWVISNRGYGDLDGVIQIPKADKPGLIKQLEKAGK